MQELCDEIPNPIEESEGGKVTELEQLRLNLQTLEAAAKVPGMRPKTYEQIEAEIVLNERRIAALEADQPVEPDPWAEAKRFFRNLEQLPEFSSNPDKKIINYVRHLEATIERDTLAYGKLAAHAAGLLKERNEARTELAKRPVLESADHLREKLAELTTIANAIPPACPEAQKLVQARIDSVKKEMSDNG